MGMTTTTAMPGRTRATLPPGVEALLRRSDAHIVAADLAADPAERFVHGHLAALRAGAALVAAAPPVARRRGRPRPVWDLVAQVAPELGDAAAWFAQGAGVRAAFEAGRAPDVSPERADLTVAAAEEFQEAVRRALGGRGDRLTA